MKTELDSTDLILLETLEYDCSEARVIAVVVECFSSDEPESLVACGKDLGPAYAVEPSDASRRFQVEFGRPVAWQCVDESYTTWSEDEERDDTCYLQVLTKSPYLNYVMANHGWHRETVGPSTHYRLRTADEVLDVVSLEEPTVLLLPTLQ